MKFIVKYILPSITLFSLVSCSHSGKRKKLVDHAPAVIRPKSDNEQKASSSPVTLNTLYQENKDAVFLIYTLDGEKYHQGSGFFISSTGVGISNYHVFEGTFRGKEIIKLLNGQEYQISEVLASSKELDYIIFHIKSNGEKFPFTQLSNKEPMIGEGVFAIGNPKGLESTLSTGIVSSIRDKEHLIQTTAEITNGSSGGPLFNLEGKVIGITSSGMGEANLNFAVDIRVLNLDSLVGR